MTTVLSTAYYPPIQYFTKLIGLSEVSLEQYENYQKQTYRNRCIIAAANGVLPLIVPVVKNYYGKTLIRDVRIDYSEQWQRNHWRTIESAYRSSPFFEYYADYFYQFYENKEAFLFDLNEKIFRILVDLTGLKINIKYTGQFSIHYPENDFRNLITPKINYTTDLAFKPQIYYQVFAPVNGFAANMSIFDLLCNEGPNTFQTLCDSTSP